uniref:rRNA N-glycosidase n=1 Tax=Oryza brachyantha TaxID=4533 RepID=J3LZL0_ORYBR
MALLRSLACSLFLLCSSLTFGAANGMYGRVGVEDEAEEESRTATDGARGAASGWPGYLYTRAVGRCTPQKWAMDRCVQKIQKFWSSGAEQWPNIIPQEAAVSKVFGSRSIDRYGPRLTVLEATMRTDDSGSNSAFAKLVKQGSAALLNAYARRGFPLDSWEVKALLLEALVSEDAAAAQADRFEQANESCV